VADSTTSDIPAEVPARPLPPLAPLERLRDAIDQWRDRGPWLALALLAVTAFGIAWYVARPPATAKPPPELALPVATPIPVPTPRPATITVHVAGAVLAPDVIATTEGARVVDVVELAGGLASDADLDRVNLAGQVVDGERIWIPRLGEDEPLLTAGDSTADGSDGDPSGPVNLNRATAEQLEALPGVGPATAAAIVRHREEQGPFGQVDSLLDVPGIGTAKLESIRPLATV